MYQLRLYSSFATKGVPPVRYRLVCLGGRIADSRRTNPNSDVGPLAVGPQKPTFLQSKMNARYPAENGQSN